jgi:hypothetical protein
MKKKEIIKHQPTNDVMYMYLIKFLLEKKVMREIRVEACNIREATAIALNLIGGLFYWDEIKVESL